MEDDLNIENDDDLRCNSVDPKDPNRVDDSLLPSVPLRGTKKVEYVSANNTTFYCEKCNYRCKYRSHYEQHLKSGKHLTGKITKIHTKERIKKEKKIHQCEKCEFTSTHIYNFKTHLLNNHSTVEEKKKEYPYYCECCDYGIFSKDSFDKHLLTKKHYMKSK